MIELQSIADEIKGKDVGVVGNAASLLHSKRYFGRMIDSMDFVIRFNRGFIMDEDRQGHKTDMLCLAIEMPEADIDRFNAKYVVNRCTMKRNKTRACTHFNKGETDRMAKYLGAKPSTGFMAIDFCVRAGAKHVWLFGFDWGDTPTYYNPADYKTPHNYMLERATLESLLHDKIIIVDSNKWLGS